jgi:hypothetical protein
MRAKGRAAVTIGVLVLALLPMTAAVARETSATPEIPVAITQPVGDFARILGSSSSSIPDAGLIMLVGSGLLGLGAIVRRSTRV